MNTSLRLLLWHLVAILGLAQTAYCAQVEIVPTVEFVGADATNYLILTFAVRTDGKESEEIATLSTNGSRLAPESFKVLEIKDGKESTLKVINVRYNRAEPLLRSLWLYTDPQPSEGHEYRVEAADQALVFVISHLVYRPANLTATTKAEGGISWQEGLTRKIELAGGTPGGIGSVSLDYKKSGWLDSSWMNLQLAAKADLTLTSNDRSNFFNNVTFSGNFYENFGLWGRRWEVFAGGKAESDQVFEKVNALGGGGLATYLENPVTRFIQKGFASVPSIAPFVLVRYDYVSNVKDEAGGTSSDGWHSHRVTAVLRWTLVLAKEQDLSFLQLLDKKTNIKVEFDLQGIYDSRPDKFNDASRISLVLEPAGGSDKTRPAIVFTWARGKEAPTFQQISAFLAGMKLSF